MTTSAPPRTRRKASVPPPTFTELYVPKLITVLREGYGLMQFRADALAGLTVAIVALPLSMAIAIASGATPAQGLYTAIIGGVFVSALGGSRFQIGGPAGAFIVLVASTIAVHGMEGFFLATIMAGVMLMLIGLFRFGTLIKFIPYPVTVGFTAGIAVIIFASQIKNLLGLTLTEAEPGPLLEKLPVLWASLPSFDALTIVLAALSILVITGLKALRPNWPGMLIAVTGAGVATAVLNLPVATIGSAFGGIPTSFPAPHLPEVSLALVSEMLPAAFAFALLGSIESLLSAVVADGMTGRRHRSNCELVAQGAANIASGLFGGLCVTGTIARTATNVRAGAHGPIAGIMHAAFLLAFILVAAPLASFIPLAALAGVLAVVAWNMIEKHAFAMLLRASRGDALVLMATFLITIFRDLTEAIVIGVALGSLLFIYRMSKVTAVEADTAFDADDRADTANGERTPYDERLSANPDVVVFRISGAFFFGAAASIGSILDRIADRHRVLIIDFAAVPFLDSTAAFTIESLARKTAHRGVRIVLTGTSDDVRHDLIAHDIDDGLVSFAPSVEAALADAEASTNQPVA